MGPNRAVVVTHILTQIHTVNLTELGFNRAFSAIQLIRENETLHKKHKKISKNIKKCP